MLRQLGGRAVICTDRPLSDIVLHYKRLCSSVVQSCLTVWWLFSHWESQWQHLEVIWLRSWHRGLESSAQSQPLFLPCCVNESHIFFIINWLWLRTICVCTVWRIFLPSFLLAWQAVGYILFLLQATVWRWNGSKSWSNPFRKHRPVLTGCPCLLTFIYFQWQLSVLCYFSPIISPLHWCKC